jgi:CRP/FNR family transcriptional regulator
MSITPTPMPTMHTESCEACTARRPGWFCDLPLDALAEYDALSAHIMAPSGSILFNEGQRPHGVSIVCVGQVKLTKTSPEGKTLLIRVANPGEVLGLSAALCQTQYEVTAQALDWTQLKTFRREDFLKFLSHHVEGSLNAARSLNHEYRAALADACRLALSSTIAGRMAHLLLQFASEAGVAQDDSPVFRSLLKHDDLAAMLGSSRESVTRVLNDLKRKGIIEIKGNKIRLLRKHALEALL